MKIERTGLLYRLALWGVFFESYKIDYHSKDVCTFTRKVLFGTFFIIPLTIIVSVLVLYAIGTLPFNLIMWGITGVLLNPEIVYMWISLVCLLFVLGLIIYVVEKWGLIKSTVGEKVDDVGPLKEFKEFTKTAYKSWKEKTCVFIEFKG